MAEDNRDRPGEPVTRVVAEFLEGATGTDGQPPSLPSEKIGPYTIVSEIGRGGMGCVLEAVQEEPLRRRVAIKLILAGIDTEDVMRRFESERRALALMSHPNVARVYDAGSTDEGRPYFAMELVEGEPITSYCDDLVLPVSRRLELFLQVCAGVHHAHQKGVIHRDLKPGNVLVTSVDGEPVPKIIDFGVAKAVHDETEAAGGQTRLGQWVGTPAFMSPEQITDSANVDVRSDVYSLGVLLYLLLAGALPFEPASTGDSSGELLRYRVLTEDPPRPSERFNQLRDEAASVAARRGSDPRRLLRSLRGDLDWVAMKALSRNLAQRYQSVSELAADVRRHLRHEPVSAGPPAVSYRVGRFLRRHAVASVAAGAVAVALVGGLAGTVVGLVQARAAEETARREAETSRRVADLLASIFSVADPAEGNGNTVTAREILDRGAARVETELAGEPAVRARLEAVLTRVYHNLGLYDQAVSHMQRAIEARRAVDGAADRGVAFLLLDLAWMQRQQGDLEAGRATMDEALDVIGEHHVDDLQLHAGALFVSGVLERDLGRLESARRSLEEALSIREQEYGPEDLRVAWTLLQLGWTHFLADETQLSLRRYERALELMERLTGPDSYESTTCRSELATVLGAAGEVDRARALYAEIIEHQERTLGPHHPILAATVNNLGTLLWFAGEVEEAGRCFERTLEIRRAGLGPRHPDVAVALMNVAVFYASTGRWHESRPMYEEAAAIQTEIYGPDHPNVARTFLNLAGAEAHHGDRRVAEDHYERALGILRRCDAVDSSRVSYDLACYWAAMGDRQRALEFARRAVDQGFGPLGFAPGLHLLDGDPEFEALRSAAGTPSEGSRTEPAGPQAEGSSRPVEDDAA